MRFRRLDAEFFTLEKMILFLSLSWEKDDLLKCVLHHLYLFNQCPKYFTSPFQNVAQYSQKTKHTSSFLHMAHCRMVASIGFQPSYVYCRLEAKDDE